MVGTTASAGTNNSGTPVYYGGSSKPTLLVMGVPGYYQSGYGAANGGQGGGWGGKGANSSASCTPNTGSNGIQGIAGFNGGNAGRGGNGGGAMIIKANTVVITNSGIVFDASGQHGTPGGNGGYGGAGGLGGDGGPGCCSSGTPIPQGGNGGHGDTGAGGDGGDGGNGGATGYIWIGTTSYTTSAGSRKKNFSFFAGKGGKKGWGGWSAVNTTPNNMSAMNECTGVDCSTSGGGGGSSCANAVCNPDIAMCYLSSNYTGAVSPGGNDYNFSNGSTTFARYISKNNTGDGDLEVDIPNACGTITTYKAYCKGDCDVLFKQIAGLQNVNNYTVTKPNNTSTCSSLPTLPMSINYIDGSSGNIPLLEYMHTDINVPATLTDVSGESDNVGTFTTCFSLSITGTEFTFVTPYDPAPIQATPGNDGVGGTTPPPNTGAGNQQIM